jgi:hypothetical protein
VVVYDWNSNGEHSLIGEFFTTLRALLDEPHARKFTVIHPEKKVLYFIYTIQNINYIF